MGETPKQEEPDIYRDNLAEAIKGAPKEDRKDVLDRVKEDPEYWDARNKKVEAGQDEEPINDGMGVFVKNRTLYHGSATPEIKKEGKFKKAVESTVGEGVYLTSQTKDAIGYAHTRIGSNPYGKAETEPTIYETSIESL